MQNRGGSTTLYILKVSDLFDLLSDGAGRGYLCPSGHLLGSYDYWACEPAFKTLGLKFRVLGFAN